MKAIKVVEPFAHSDLWEPRARAFTGGVFKVVERPSQPDEISERGAAVALQNGWAVEAEVSDDVRPSGSPTGADKQPSSSGRARRSTGGRSSKRSSGKRKSSS